jgi:hypothetical protein
LSTTLDGVSVWYPNRSTRPHPVRGERLSHGRGIYRWGISTCLRPKRRASTEPQPSPSIARAAHSALKKMPSGVDTRSDDRFRRARSGKSRKVLGVARSIGSAGFQPDDAAAKHIGVDGVRTRPEQAERRATACTRNHRERAVVAGHERSRDGRGGEHECNDPCAKPKRKRERESDRKDYGGVWRELWKWKARDHQESNPRAGQSQQHERNSGSAVRITR